MRVCGIFLIKLYFKAKHGDEVYNVMAAYECRSFTGELNYDQEEATAISFFSLDQLPKRMSPPDKQIIDYYLQKVVK